MILDYPPFRCWFGLYLRMDRFIAGTQLLFPTSLSDKKGARFVGLAPVGQFCKNRN
jgi:hypothetical protein